MEKKFTSYSGIISVVLYLIVAILLIDTPSINSPSIDILSYMRVNQKKLLIAVYIWGLCISATYCFLAGYWAISKKEEKESTLFSTLGLGSGFVIFAVAFCGFLFALVAGYRAESISPEIAKLLNDLTTLSVALTGFPTAVSMISFSYVITKTNFLPKWIAIFGFFIAFLHIVSAGAFASAGLFSPSGIGVYIAPVFYYLWILIVSIIFLKRKNDI